MRNAAVKAGAKFIVSPGFDPEIVNYCLEKEIPIFPGCVTPSEVAQAVKRGLKVVKFFPAEPAGGVAMIKAMAAPYNQLRFMPTGGIGTQNLKDYLGFDKIICCGGSWMVKADLIKNGEFEKIRSVLVFVPSWQHHSIHRTDRPEPGHTGCCHQSGQGNPFRSVH